MTKIYQQTLVAQSGPGGTRLLRRRTAGGPADPAIDHARRAQRGDDRAGFSTTVANKLEVADYFTAKVAAGCDYGGEQAGVDAITPVTHLPATVTAAKAAIDTSLRAGRRR